MFHPVSIRRFIISESTTVLSLSQPRKRDIIGLARVTRNGTRVDAVDIADESRPGKESTLEKVPRSETRRERNLHIYRECSSQQKISDAC